MRDIRNTALQPEYVAQILHDADCPEEFTQRFLQAMRAGTTKDQLVLLHVQRRRQLERVHVEEKKLDILDFLGYQLQKAEKLSASASI